MASTRDDDAGGLQRTDRCASCGAPLAPDQRYCIGCGARRGPLPQAIAAQISLLLRRWRLPDDAEAAAAPAEETEPESGPWGFMPGPRAAAIAVMGMLALGVLLGSATSQIAQSAGIAPIFLEVPPPQPPAEEAEGEAVRTASAPEPEAAAEAPPPLTYTEAAPPAAAPAQTPAEEPELVPFNPEEGAAEELPPVKHVFLIVLGENGFEETFGETSTAPYLSKTLPERGELLKNYYAVTAGTLANEVAMVSGQGPTPETEHNCPNYADIVPGTESPAGQVEGDGCVYPATTETLAGELAAKKLTWRAYVEDMENGALSGQPRSCRHPELGTADPNQAPTEGDAYVTWRNPFVYFHSIIDSPECASNDVGLEALTADLRSAKRTPALSLIVPNACHSGGETPCAEGQPSGAVASEEFLRKVVPAITASAAYEEGGLIAITSAQAPQSGEHADSSACCVYPEYPNLALAEGPQTEEAPAAETPAAGIESEGAPTAGTGEGAEGAPTEGGGGESEGAPAEGIQYEAAEAGGAPAADAEARAQSVEGANGEGEGETTRGSGGGGRVGMLLISPFVKPGSVNESNFNHYTLLLTIEELFELEKLGYSQELALKPFEGGVFNNAEEEPTAEEPTAAK